MQDVLKERASGVRVTHRLTDSPACLVSDEHGMSMNLERLLKASGQKVPTIKPILEINPHHPIVERLKDESDAEPVLGLEPHPVRSGDAGRGRSARRPRDVREAAQRVDARARRRPRVADLDARRVTAVAPAEGHEKHEIHEIHEKNVSEISWFSGSRSFEPALPWLLARRHTAWPSVALGALASRALAMRLGVLVDIRILEARY